MNEYIHPFGMDESPPQKDMRRIDKKGARQKL